MTSYSGPKEKVLRLFVSSDSQVRTTYSTYCCRMQNKNAFRNSTERHFFLAILHSIFKYVYVV